MKLDPGMHIGYALGFLWKIGCDNQPPGSSTLLSEQTSHQQPASSTFLSEQSSTSHQPLAKRTGCRPAPNVAGTTAQATWRCSPNADLMLEMIARSDDIPPSLMTRLEHRAARWRPPLNVSSPVSSFSPSGAGRAPSSTRG
jgi:hypothetical protein